MTNYKNSKIYRITDYRDRFEYYGASAMPLRYILYYQEKRRKIIQFNQNHWWVRIERVKKIPCETKEQQNALFQGFLYELRSQDSETEFNKL